MTAAQPSPQSLSAPVVSDVLVQFDDVVARMPHRIAISSCERSFSYAGLCAESTALARDLKQVGVGVESIVLLDFQTPLTCLDGGRSSSSDPHHIRRGRRTRQRGETRPSR